MCVIAVPHLDASADPIIWAQLHENYNVCTEK